MPLPRFLLVLFSLCLFFSVYSAYSADAPPVSAFSGLPVFDDVALSPSGERMAFIENNREFEEGTLLAAYDLTSKKRYYLLRSDNEKVKINWFKWANDDILVVSALYEAYRDGLRFYQTRLLSVRYDDEEREFTNLIDDRYIERFSKVSHRPQFQDSVISWLPDDPDHILLAIDIHRPLLASVMKINVRNGTMSQQIKGKSKVRNWLSDQQGHPRIAVSTDYEEGDSYVYLVEPEEEWQILFSYNVLKEPAITPLGFGLDPNVLYYRAYKDNYKAIFTLNLTTKISTLVFSDDEYDVDGSLIYSSKTRDVIGVRHSNTPNGRHYWDNRYKELQDGLDKALPDTLNTLVSFNNDESVYILRSSGDSQPPLYFIGNRHKKSLEFLFAQYPELDATTLPVHQLVEYKARDNTLIEAYLTLPVSGKAPYPTIIHPHGGPNTRDYSGFDYWTAFFASRGYAVLRPNFRGSSGYGYDFAIQQLQGWGLQMQDDLTDATKWMIEQGYSDVNKMCIVGASYGGYAALMATVKTPELFKCAVSFAGVSDLSLIVSRSRRFTNKEFVKRQFGDDDDDLEARSPVEHVKTIQTPILLIHGDEDRVVDVSHSRDMAAELDDYDKIYRYVELRAGDHYLSIQRNRDKLFEEMEVFLSKYLQ